MEQCEKLKRLNLTVDDITHPLTQFSHSSSFLSPTHHADTRIWGKIEALFICKITRDEDKKSTHNKSSRSPHRGRRNSLRADPKSLFSERGIADFLMSLHTLRNSESKPQTVNEKTLLSVRGEPFQHSFRRGHTGHSLSLSLTKTGDHKLMHREIRNASSVFLVSHLSAEEKRHEQISPSPLRGGDIGKSRSPHFHY